MKFCPRCKLTKPSVDFAGNKAQADGLQSYCRKCSTVIAREWHQRHREKSRANAKRRYRADIEKWRAYHREHERKRVMNLSLEAMERHLERQRIRSAESKKRNPAKVAARSALNKAVARGEVVRMPCEVCGEIKVHGHHENYEKPLNVRWLCPLHHAAAERGDIRLEVVCL